MIKVGLIPDDKTKEALLKTEQLEDINTESPFKKDRPFLRYFEEPEVIHAKVNTFRKNVSFDRSICDAEVEQMIKLIRDDMPIYEKFDQQSDEDIEDEQQLDLQ